MTNTTTPGFLTDAAPPMLLFGGKGGVGKTTTACATAFHLARANPDQRILLVSTDPAHSTSDALADAQLPENLRLVELDAGAEHERFMAEHATVLHEIASRGTFLDDADIEGFLELSLPGVDELMCFVRIADWLDTGEADRIVIDTAPTGHALRLLAMPHVLDGWLEAIDALLGKHRYMAGLFGGSGGSQTDAVENFVEDVTNKFAALAEAWSDEDACRFVPVCNAEPLSLSETSRLLDDLDTLDIDAPDIVVNRLVPLAGANDAAGDEEPGDEDPGLAARRVSQHAALHASLSEDQTPFDDRSLIAIPLLASEPRGAGLEDFFSAALPIDPAALQAGTASSDISPLPAVAGGIAPPAAAHRLVLTAGKGGVGKTTMAASLAAATAASDRPVLLVSTDPAGSLGDVFNAEVTDDPATLASNLRVMQIDAEVEFEALKEMYADELEAFMDNLSSAMDLAFDREALEHLLDLAPPGLDEVMALVRVTEFLDEANPDELLVLDTAPTGHLLRLLELPSLIQDWLSAIFRVLVKYENLISMPRLNERLLRLSKGLKTLRGILEDADRASVYAVAIPTELCVAETGRLLEGCASRSLTVGGVIINQATTNGAHPLAAAMHAREAIAINGIQQLGRPTATVERGGDLRGAEILAALGSMIFAPASTARQAA